jgi:ferritin-like metal-binding protein YciE
MNSRDTLLAWLNDAYGMEQNLIQSLQTQINGAEEYPDIKARLEMHLAQTRAHEELVRQCIESLGSSPSTAKAALGMLSGMMSGMMNKMSSDEMVKNCIADFSMEHMEIASYTSLIAAAEAVGEPYIVNVCRQILQEEEEMAQWLFDQIPRVTNSHLSQAAYA